MSAATAAQRAQVIAGLRELADLLDTHPELPVPQFPKIRVAVDHVSTDIDESDDEAGRAFVDQAAAVLGIPAVSHNGHYDTTWLARGEEEYPGDQGWHVLYQVGHINTAAWAQYQARMSYQGNIEVPA